MTLRGNGDAQFNRKSVHIVNNSADDELQKLIDNDAWSQGASTHRYPGSARPERLFDIPAEPGLHLYAIHLNATVRGRQDLYFVEDKPVMQFAAEGTGCEGLITDAKCLNAANGRARWASFRFDTNDMIARISAMHVDNHIHEQDQQHENPHGTTALLPFFFRLRDGNGTPTWLRPRHDNPLVKEGLPQAEFGHGGAHPPLSSFLQVDTGS